MDKTFKLIAWHPTGSRHICDPPPMNTDNDTVILVTKEDLNDIDIKLRENGWVLGGSFIASDIWFSYKKGTENYIITTMPDHYQKWITATRIAKKFNMLKKEDRIDLFRVIVDGEYDAVKTFAISE